MKAERRRRILVVVAACGLGLVLLDSLVLRPLLAAWDSQSERIARSSADIERGRALLEREADILDRWKEMKSGSLPAETGSAETMVLDAIGKWAAKSGLEVGSVRPRWVTMKGVGDRMEIRLSAEGDMSTVTRFLYELETTSLPISLDETQVRARDDDGSVLGVDLVFSGLRIGGTSS